MLRRAGAIAVVCGRDAGDVGDVLAEGLRSVHMQTRQRLVFIELRGEAVG